MDQLRSTNFAPNNPRDRKAGRPGEDTERAGAAAGFAAALCLFGRHSSLEERHERRSYCQVRTKSSRADYRAQSPGLRRGAKALNAMIDKRPLLIARCADVADVIAAVEFRAGQQAPHRHSRRRTQWSRSRQRQRRPSHRPLDDEGRKGRPQEQDCESGRGLHHRRRRSRDPRLPASLLTTIYHMLKHATKFRDLGHDISTSTRRRPRSTVCSPN